MLMPFVQRSRRQFNATARRMLVRSVTERDFAKRLNKTRFPEALAIRTALESHPLLPCVLDRGLLNRTRSRTGMLYFASVLKDAERLMPQLVVQVCRLALRLPNGALFVSIYESGSQDQTPQWLLLLKELLDLLRCPNRLVIHGAVRQRNGESKSQFVARLRNAVLEPLRSFEAWRVERVVFVDDVFFCAQQILRLEALQGDVVCGMDFVSASASRSWGGEAPLMFRDVWASIDITGRHFRSQPPFLLDAYGREMLYKGWPFPAHACWNGIVALNPTPFFKNVSFRGVANGACPASEGILLSQDFVQSGFGRIAVEPNVRVTYDFRIALSVQKRSSNGHLPFVPFAPTNVSFPHHPETVDCCVRSEKEGTLLKFKICRKDKLKPKGQQHL